MGAAEIFRHLSSVSGYALYVPADYARNGPALDAESFDRATQYPFRAFNFFAVPLQRTRVR